MRCGIIKPGKGWLISHPTSVVQYLPFDLAQGGESFDFAQDRESVERLVKPFLAFGLSAKHSPLYLLPQEAYFDNRYVVLESDIV
jgi:hypothetical protein